MKLIFAPAAEQDLGDIFEYITNNLKNPTAARNISTKILRRIQYLKNFPEAGPSLEAADSKLKGYRYLAIDNYLVIYRIHSLQVQIVRIIYARSNYLRLLQG